MDRSKVSAHGRFALLSLIVLFASPAQASASSLARNFSGTVLTYTGSGSTSDAPFIDQDTLDGAIGISTNQVITAIPSGCSYVISNMTWVECPAGPTRLVVNLGSADDSVRASQIDFPMELNGGSGNDDLLGGEAADTINGGDGHDTLTGDGVFGGSGSHDTLDGGAGDDSLRGGVGRDELRGGPGVDEAYYLNRTAGVTDLAQRHRRRRRGG